MIKGEELLKMGDLKNKSFKDETLIGWVLESRDFSGTTFENCYISFLWGGGNLSNVVFKNCTFSNTRFQGCTFENTIFDSCKIENCKIILESRVNNVKFIGCNIYNFNIPNNMNNVSFKNSHLKTCEFKGMKEYPIYLNNVSFEGSTLNNIEFKHVRTNVSFDNVKSLVKSMVPIAGGLAYKAASKLKQ